MERELWRDGKDRKGKKREKEAKRKIKEQASEKKSGRFVWQIMKKSYLAEK